MHDKIRVNRNLGIAIIEKYTAKALFYCEKENIAKPINTIKNKTFKWKSWIKKQGLMVEIQNFKKCYRSVDTAVVGISA